MEDTLASPAPRGSRRLRIGLIVGLGLAAAAGAFWAFGSLGGTPEAEASVSPTKKSKDAKEKEPPSVAVAAAEHGAISAFTSATANLVAEDEVKILAEAEGKIVKLAVEEGDDVEKGQTLALIDPADAALAVQKADLGLRNAQLTLDRSERMATEQLISAQDLDKARYERDNAAQILAEARHTLSKTNVRAAFAGRITVRRAQPGQHVKRGDELFTLADFEPLIARIYLPEREVLGLRVGQEVRLVLRADEATRCVGRLRQISPVVDTASGTVKVTVEAVKPPAGVRPGAFVSVEVLRETRPQALLVPRQALVRELKETYVFVAEGKVARKRAVETGLEEGDRVEIVAGLKAGEQVITSGQGGLKDNAAIVIASKG